MTGQLLNIAQAAAALDASVGSLGDESAAPTMAGCAPKPDGASGPDCQGFRRNADIAFAKNDPISRSGWFERLELDEGLLQVFGHRDFTARLACLWMPH